MSLSEVLDKHLRLIQNPTPVQDCTFATPKSGSDGPTAKQVSYYQALVERKQLTEDQRKHLRSSLSAFDRRTITTTISWLMGLPWQPRPSLLTPPTPSPLIAPIKQGRYAVMHPIEGDLRFYSVRKPTEGKWAGFTFLAQLSGENQIAIRDKQERERIYSAIAKDATGAMRLYGQKIGQCGHCRKQLTDEVSREFGIGPVCRKALGL